MSTTDGETIIEVSKSTFDLDSLITSFDGYPDFKAGLQSAEVLIIPSDLSPEYDGPVFPNTTSQVFQSLKTGLEGHAVVDVAIRDEDYVNFEFLSDDVILPVVFVAKEVFLPLIVNLIASYLHPRIANRERQSDARVKSEIHVDTDKGVRYHIKYEGPVESFERIALKALEDAKSYPKDS